MAIFHVSSLLLLIATTTSSCLAFTNNDSTIYRATTPISRQSPLSSSSSSLAFVCSKQHRSKSRSNIIKTYSTPENNDPIPSPPPPSSQSTPLMLQPPISNDQVSTATSTLTQFDQLQQEFISTENQGWGGGTSALHFLQNLSPENRLKMKEAVLTLTQRANYERSLDSSKGRIMLGFCCANAYEALGGLKSWVSSLSIPRGLLHGMDIDGVPQPLENFGAVYVKYSTGGAMTFSEMRKTGIGFDALWKPGDALLETYDGDFRGVYLNLELEDGVFRQFGVLPTDLFMEGEDEDEWDD